ncbi:ribbon-helix-helix protein, CopG family [Halorubrum sp. FL23]|uniref:ribbon-helix-helix protein, CopG family n=1 Tax=Halorubrum sp. FL23 TaxID=3458704 RepID=UPI004034AB0B
MAIDRVIVSLDEDANEAIDDLTERSGRGQSEVFRPRPALYGIHACSYECSSEHARAAYGDAVGDKITGRDTDSVNNGGRSDE